MKEIKGVPKFCPFCGFPLTKIAHTDENSKKQCGIHGDIEDMIIGWTFKIFTDRAKEKIKNENKNENNN